MMKCTDGTCPAIETVIDCESCVIAPKGLLTSLAKLYIVKDRVARQQFLFEMLSFVKKHTYLDLCNPGLMYPSPKFQKMSDLISRMGGNLSTDFDMASSSDYPQRNFDSSENPLESRVQLTTGHDKMKSAHEKLYLQRKEKKISRRKADTQDTDEPIEKKSKKTHPIGSVFASMPVPPHDDTDSRKIIIDSDSE